MESLKEVLLDIFLGIIHPYSILGFIFCVAFSLFVIEIMDLPDNKFLYTNLIGCFCGIMVYLIRKYHCKSLKDGKTPTNRSGRV